MKKVIILRGLPGSGKSTWAKAYSYDQDGVPICSADDRLTAPDGTYRFNPADIHKAHRACYWKFIDCIGMGAPQIIVDNTNTRHWEYKMYVDVAKARGYDVEIKVFEISVEDSVKRNVHNVPRETIERMAKRWEK